MKFLKVTLVAILSLWATQSYAQGKALNFDTQWKQGKPFNGGCPINKLGQQAIVGCVPLAMAQFLAYNGRQTGYPMTARGRVTYTDRVPLNGITGQFSVDFSQRQYDWNSINPDSSQSNTNTNQFLFDCGVALNVDYGTGDPKKFVGIFPNDTVLHGMPGENAERVLRVLQNNFFYTGGEVISGDGLISRSPNAADFARIKAEIDAGYPVIMLLRGGLLGEAGHCVIVDGYTVVSGVPFYRMRMGWGGIDDGYYRSGFFNFPKANLQMNVSFAVVVGARPPRVPSLSLADVTTSEGDSGQKDVSVTATLSEKPLSPLSYSFTTINDTATAPSDYIATSGTLTFPAGQTRATLKIRIVGDGVVEPAETFRVSIAPTIYPLAKGSATVTILNDDAPTPTPPPSSASGKIAFTSTVNDGSEQIYVINANGTNQTQLTHSAGYSAQPAFSTDGEKIAFMSNRSGDREIYVMNADGTNQKQLTHNKASRDDDPAFSPDGSKITFMSTLNGNQEIFVMNANGTDQTRLTNTPNAYEDDPAFSPDGTKIAFMSNRSGANEIYVMNANGGNQTQLTHLNSSRGDSPAWSLDGSKIAFMSVIDGNQEIFVMNANGAGQTRLTKTLSAWEDSPTFSPDGTKIAFMSNRSSANEIYVMNANGTNQVQVTHNNANRDDDPSWAPGTVPTPPSASPVVSSVPSGGAS